MGALEPRHEHRCFATIAIEPASNDFMLTVYPGMKENPEGTNMSDLQIAETMFGRKLVAGLFAVQTVLTSHKGSIEAVVKFKDKLQLRQFYEALNNVPK